MGASGWRTATPWCADLGEALAAARASAYLAVPAAERSRVPPDAKILAGLDLDPDDAEPWARWLATAPPETRYAAWRALFGGTHSVLDVDHVGDATRAEALGPGPYTLAPPRPGLGVVRAATADQLLAWFATERPTELGDEPFDDVPSGEAVAVTRWDGDRPVEIVLFGVTGD